MNRLLFIIPALPDFVPYIYNYFKIANERSIEYDVVCWNRKGDQVELPDNYFIYQRATKDSYSNIIKIKEIYGYYRYVKRILKKRDYQLVFSFTIAESVFFEPLLRNKYKGRYVFDIRDYSPMVDHVIFKRRILRLLHNSGLNVISSEGYKQWLPGGYEYVVCHNTDVEKIMSLTPVSNDLKDSNNLVILTIGAIRNVQVNIKVIDAFRNKDGVHLQFVGDGIGAPVLEKYCLDNQIKNVSFHGRYNKIDEDTFVHNCSLLNIMLPSYQVSEMSNRFYLSVRLRRPMIVNDGCFQAEQVKKYGIGLVISDWSRMYEDVLSFWKSLDWDTYNSSCLHFQKDTYYEMMLFKQEITRLIDKCTCI